jgi:hypothetical protein
MDLTQKARQFRCWFDEQRRLAHFAFGNRAIEMIQWGMSLEILKDWEGQQTVLPRRPSSNSGDARDRAGRGVLP